MGTTVLLPDIIVAATMGSSVAILAVAPGTASLAGMEGIAVSATALGIASSATMEGIVVGIIVAFRVMGISVVGTLAVDITLGVGEDGMRGGRRMESIVDSTWDACDFL